MKIPAEIPQPLFLTVVEIEAIRAALEQMLPRRLTISLNLGRSHREVILTDRNSFLLGETPVALTEVLFRKPEDRTIFIFEQEAWKKWQRFDSATGKFYKMVFTAPARPPTIEISGVKMHVTKDADPVMDTGNKIATLHKISGTVLDTCLGLGYTAIACAEKKQVKRVLVCEADMNVFHLCRQNPWSAALFANRKIQPVLVPAQDFISGIPDSYFDVVLHDPPRFAMSPELYSEKFYRDLFRIMKRGGELYHYTGNPNQRVRKKSLLIQTRELLTQVGFRQVKQAYFGVAARK